MAELQIIVSDKNALTRSEGTPALAGNEARIVVETTYSPFQIMQALRKLEADLRSVYSRVGGAHVFSAVAFDDHSRFDDGASFSDQNILGL